MAIPDYLNLPFFERATHVFARELDDWASAVLPGLLEDEESDPDIATCQLVEALGRDGWLTKAISLGKERPLNSVELCLCRDILASHSALADFAFAMQGLGSGPIGLYGSEAQRARYLPGVAAGTQVAAFALTEPEVGSDVAATSLAAVREGDEYVLNGTKTFISNAGIANFYVVFARTGEPGSKGLSAFVVEAEDLGVDAWATFQVMSPHPIGEIKFRSVRIPAERRLGEEGQGFAIAMSTLDVFRVSVGAAALGLSRRAFAEALRRSKTRQMFGTRLGMFQLTQAKIADMALAIEASAMLVYRAAWLKASAAVRTTREASMAKLFATEQAQIVIDHAVQLHGGLGVVRGQVVERLYRDVRALRIYEGATEVQKLIIAGHYLKGGQ